ncbi:MAG: nicotinate-nucleotide adenylyltransferase [Chloroflexota bacterium]
MKIGILGGTFDPIHIGHLVLCQEAQYQLGLGHILLLPAADPPHKQNQQIAAVSHRLEMLSLAVSQQDSWSISRIDVERPGPHYTVDTMKLLQHIWGDDAELYFLMGLDSLRDLPTWYRPEWLVTHCHLVTFSRADVEVDWTQLQAALPNIRQRVSVLEMPELDISSSDIRRRVLAKRPIRYLVTDEVAEYIQEHNLYSVNSPGQLE